MDEKTRLESLKAQLTRAEARREQLAETLELTLNMLFQKMLDRIERD